MKASIVSLVLGASLAAAQFDQLKGIPKCAQSCVTSYVSGNKIAGCTAADFKCVCGNKDFIGGISCCIGDKCNKEDSEKTIQFAAQVCKGVGVDTPTELVCNNGTDSGSDSGSGKNGTDSSTNKTDSGDKSGDNSGDSKTDDKKSGAAMVGSVSIAGLMAVVAAAAL